MSSFPSHLNYVHTAQDTKELEEKEKRKTSLIIHGIKEPESAESSEREEDDLGVVTSMIHELKCDNDTMKKAN